MHDLILRNHQRARLWLDEDCPAECRNAPILVEEVASGHQPPVISSVVLEVVLPWGAMSSYGLLGFSFAPHSGDRLRLIIPAESGQVWYSPLASNEEVRLGLPHEFAAPVLARARRTASACGLTAGTVGFWYAASGSVGSSVALFEELAHLLLSGAVQPGSPTAAFWQKLLIHHRWART
jgi:hypothetical protein